MMRILGEIVVTLNAYPAISLVAKGTVIAALGLIGAWIARRSRAAVRHAVLASTFSVLLALPVVSFLATPVSVAVPIAKGEGNTRPLFDYTSAPSSGEPATERSGAIPEKSGWSLFPLSTMLLYRWFIGAALFMIPIVRGLLQVRSLRRYGLPWRDERMVTRRRVEILLHESLPGPMTCGVLHPVIILPADAQSWDKQDLERALIHELEHVRRYDWAIHCLARLACAAYWFHPLVWIAWRQLTLEAERSCDDAVLKNSEPTAYADQLVGLARRRRLSAAQKSPALAMANRSDLAARVGAVLDSRQARGRAGTFLVTVVCTVAAVLALTMSSFRMIAAPQSASAPAQSSAATPIFEVASIKPCKPEAKRGGGNSSPGRLSSGCSLLADTDNLGLIQRAYVMFAGGHLNRLRVLPIEGAPEWTHAEFFEIDAKAEGNPTRETMEGPMMQALLEDRFKLKIHREVRQGPVYELSPAKGVSKLKPFQEGSCAPPPSAPPLLPLAPGQAYCMFMVSPRGTADAEGRTLTELSGLLSLILDRPVLDKTGITGKFDIHLRFSPVDLTAGQNEPPPGTPEAPTVFTAVEEQLGLKLVPARGPIDVLVVDHAERPSEN